MPMCDVISCKPRIIRRHMSECAANSTITSLSFSVRGSMKPSPRLGTQDSVIVEPPAPADAETLPMRTCRKRLERLRGPIQTNCLVVYCRADGYEGHVLATSVFLWIRTQIKNADNGNLHLPTMMTDVSITRPASAMMYRRRTRYEFHDA